MIDWSAFFDANKNGVFSTRDGDGISSRVWQFLWKGEDGKAYFCTGKFKRVYRQLLANPQASFCAMDKGMRTVAISGKVEFTDDLEIKKRVFDTYPMIAALYKTVDNPDFTIAVLNVEKVSSFSFADGPVYDE